MAHSTPQRATSTPSPSSSVTPQPTIPSSTTPSSNVKPTPPPAKVAPTPASTPASTKSPHIPANTPRGGGAPHIPANTPRGGGGGVATGAAPGSTKKAWPPVKSTTPTASAASATPTSHEEPVRIDKNNKKHDEGLAAAKRKGHGQPPPGMSAKLSKNFLWELKTTQKDLSRKLKPVVKKKNEKKIVDPDQPYMQELKDVQAEVLPVWRKETYAYWI